MKYLTLVLLLIPFAVYGDARCNQDIGTAHYPYTTDTDDEYKGESIVVLKEVSGTGAVACSAQTLQKNVLYTATPDPVTVHSSDAGGDCTMVNDDGAETTTARWQSKVFRENCTLRIGQNQNQARCDITYELWCGRFTPRLEE